MKLRNYSMQGKGGGAKSLTRESNVVKVWADQGKDWRKEQEIEFKTVREAKAFMNRPVL